MAVCVCVCVCVCEREKKRKRQREQREQQQQTTTALPVFHFRRFQKVDNVGLVCFELQPSCTQQCLTVRHTHGPTHDFRVHPEQQQRKMGFRTDGIRFRVPFRFTQLHRTRGGEEERRRGGEKVLVDSSHACVGNVQQLSSSSSCETSTPTNVAMRKWFSLFKLIFPSR